MMQNRYCLSNTKISVSVIGSEKHQYWYQPKHPHWLSSSCWCIVSVFTSHQYCFCVATKILCVLWCFMISVFSCDSSITFDMLMLCASQTYKKWIYITGKLQLLNPALSSLKIIGCGPHAKRVAKHLKYGLKHLHASVCQWPHCHLTYCLFIFSVRCLPQNLMLKGLISPTAKSLYEWRWVNEVIVGML